MIELEIRINDNNYFTELSVKGHSGFAAKGSDIVCSAVSILIYAVCSSLKLLESIKIDTVDDNDFFSLKLLSVDSSLLFGELRGVTLYLMTGLNLIEKTYSDYLKVKIIKVK